METHANVQLFLCFRDHGDLDALARVEAVAEDAVQQPFAHRRTRTDARVP